MNTNLREQIMDILQKHFYTGYGEDLPIDEASFIADQILVLFRDTTKMSQSYPQEYKISTSKETVNLEEYIKASQHDGL